MSVARRISHGNPNHLSRPILSGSPGDLSTLPPRPSSTLNKGFSNNFTLLFQSVPDKEKLQIPGLLPNLFRQPNSR